VTSGSAARDLFQRPPLHVTGGIPVFSGASAYTENYEHISSDHVTAIDHGEVNPFIPAAIWTQFEQSTLALIRQYAKPGDRILDVGVGLGRLLEHVPTLERHGMDISFEYLRRARERGIEVCYALVEDMPYREALFDVVVCTDVLEHVLDVNTACRNMIAVLKPGGVLITRVPYREDMRAYAMATTGYQFVHLRSFDEHGLRLLFTKIFDMEWCGALKAGFAGPGHTVYPWLDAAGGAQLGRAKRALCAVYHATAIRYWGPFVVNTVVRKPVRLPHDAVTTAGSAA